MMGGLFFVVVQDFPKPWDCSSIVLAVHSGGTLQMTSGPGARACHLFAAALAKKRHPAATAAAPKCM